MVAEASRKGTANHVATAAEARAWKGRTTNDSMFCLRPTKGIIVPGMTKLRSWFLPVAVWIALVGAFVALFAFTSGSGLPYWLVSLVVSWLPFIVLMSIWVWLSRRNRRASSGTSLVDLYEQQVFESQRTNALLERIATALEKPSAG